MSYVFHYGMKEISTFPVTLNSLSIWITAIGVWQLSHRTIKSYMTGVQLYYVEFGASTEELDIFHTPIFECIIAGIRQFNGESNIKKQHPITRLVLRAMLTKLDKNTKKGPACTPYSVWHLQNIFIWENLYWLIENLIQIFKSCILNEDRFC